MFAKVVPLNPKSHADLRVSETTDYGFAAREMMIPLVYSEMADVAREYPLVFIHGRDLPVALTGIEDGVNAYVAEDGRWLANYIPGRIQTYPFALTPMPNKPGEFAMVMDTTAPQVMQKDGQMLFDAAGQPTAFLKRRMELLERMKKAEALTAQMVRELRDSGVLINRAIRIQRRDGEDSQLAGMEVVDEKAFNALPLDAFGKLRDQGLLPLIYAHLLSMANLRHGVIAGKYPQLAQPKQPVSEADFSGMFSEDTEFKFDFDR